MDKQSLALMIPIVALLIPVSAIIFGSLVKMTRLKAEAMRGALPNPESDARLAALEQEVASLRQDLLDTQERLDFTERLLAQRGAGEAKRLES
jgi:hypothetical protein